MKSIHAFKQFNTTIGTRKKNYFTSKPVELWIAELSKKDLSHSTILSRVSALKYHCDTNNKDSSILSTPRIKRLLKGIKMKTPPKKLTKALSHKQLHKLILASSKLFQKNLKIKINSMLSLAFYGFLRPSEYCNTKAGHTLLHKNIRLKKRSLSFTLPTYKHAYQSSEIKVAATHDPTCPVRWLKKYLALDNDNSSIYLYNMDAQLFRSHLTALCKKAHLAPIGPHSLRHGGATWAAHKGWSDARLKAHGRWNSEAYKLYVRAKIN